VTDRNLKVTDRNELVDEIVNKETPVFIEV